MPTKSPNKVKESEPTVIASAMMQKTAMTPPTEASKSLGVEMREVDMAVSSLGFKRISVLATLARRSATGGLACCAPLDLFVSHDQRCPDDANEKQPRRQKYRDVHSPSLAHAARPRIALRWGD